MTALIIILYFSVLHRLTQMIPDIVATSKLPFDQTEGSRGKLHSRFLVFHSLQPAHSFWLQVGIYALAGSASVSGP